MKTNKDYKEYTIGKLIQGLKQALQDNPYLDVNSPVMISDYNMSGFKYNFGILPCFSSQHHTAGLCLFHSLGEVTEEVTPKTSLVKEETIEEDTSVVKFAQWFKG